jgi:UDP-N-acetylmuramoyl-L-alanyl-D-glutamate--2,6-diaminopimelate ligase
MSQTLHSLDGYLKLLEDHNLVIGSCIAEADKSRLISYISFNSKDIEKDTLFVCKGSHFSVDYLKAAIKKGAICISAKENILIKTEASPASSSMISEKRWP